LVSNILSFVCGPSSTCATGDDIADLSASFHISGLISSDPQFTSASDYRPTSRSLAINAGRADAPGITALDILGASRISGNAPDLGAYEFYQALRVQSRVVGRLPDVRVPIPQVSIPTIIVPTVSSALTVPPLSRILRVGSTVDDVKVLQKQLNVLGFSVATQGAGSVGSETTFFGLRTRLAVIVFQKSKDLKADGIVGNITWGALSNL
jgi:hypothetical protein